MRGDNLRGVYCEGVYCEGVYLDQASVQGQHPESR